MKMGKSYILHVPELTISVQRGQINCGCKTLMGEGQKEHVCNYVYPAPFSTGFTQLIIVMLKVEILKFRTAVDRTSVFGRFMCAAPDILAFRTLGVWHETTRRGPKLRTSEAGLQQQTDPGFGHPWMLRSRCRGWRRGSFEAFAVLVTFGWT